MRFRAPLLALLLTAILGSAAVAAPPVVVELYTSQGCSACGKANGLVGDLAKRPDVLPLTFAVDYWDYLGWTDTFAKPEFTARQRAFMRKLSQRDVYTPQIIVDGRSQASGARADKVEALIKDAAKGRGKAPVMRFVAGRFVRVDAGQPIKGGAEVWLIRYEPKTEAVEVKDGEARGETVTYVNAVRELTRLGSWTGRRRTFVIPEPAVEGLSTAIVLQGAKGGRVLGVLTR
jgi:hypothetical protein